ncbi:MAG: glycosyltransferase [Proteobacteria bacterium]|nr:glycosyltransferase [Pseudomonadota bacterium]MBU4470422.1 glycosyltransferase [Pseudomonadota bacterium]MCG2753475.1 glycosyltransferase [Desulfobacteraceae bacterium]
MKNQYTISILGTLPPIRGLSSYCFELANAMAKKCSVEFISFKKIYPSFLYPAGSPDDDHTFPPFSTSQVKVRRHLTWYNPLSWIMEGLTSRGHLLHAQWWSAPLFPIFFLVCLCFKLKNKPVILTVHNVLAHENSLLYPAISGLLFKLGDHFIVHSAINKRQMTRNYAIPSEQISVVPHGSLDFHIHTGANRKSLRKEMGLSPETKIILLFGAIRPYKGVSTAIRAFADVVKKVPDAKLLIAGALWEDWKPHEDLIKELGLEKFIILHLEYIPSGDVYKFFEVSDLCLFAYHHFSSQSGAGSVAVSFRKPMIVSKVGGLPDLVKNPRWVVPPENPSALAGAMIACLNNPNLLESMASDAEMIADQFSWSAIAERTDKIYKEALNKKFSPDFKG